MTDENMNLRALLEKTADTDFLREMIGFTAQRLMELEVESLTGAPHGSRALMLRTHLRANYLTSRTITVTRVKDSQDGFGQALRAAIVPRRRPHGRRLADAAFVGDVAADCRLLCSPQPPLSCATRAVVALCGSISLIPPPLAQII